MGNILNFYRTSIDLFPMWRKGMRRVRPILTVLEEIRRIPIHFRDKPMACVSPVFPCNLDLSFISTFQELHDACLVCKCSLWIIKASCHPSAHRRVHFEPLHCTCLLKFEVRPVDWLGLGRVSSKLRTNTCHEMAQNTLISGWKDEQVAK